MNTFFCHFHFSILLVRCILLADSFPYILDKEKKTDELTLETFPFFLATESEPTLSGPVIYISNDFCRLCPDSQRNLSFSFPSTWKNGLCTPLFKQEKKKKISENPDPWLKILAVQRVHCPGKDCFFISLGFRTKARWQQAAVAMQEKL